jgi:drug/metabolite transporter (DMT)-like permease
LESLLPSQVTFLRFFIAFVILGIFILVIKQYKVKISLFEHIKLAILGFVGIALCYYFYFKGLYYSTAFNAGLIE